MKRYDLFDWSIAPHYPYVPFRANNAETDIPNSAIMPPIPARVPGSIYKDLEKAGIIEDPYFEMNSLKAQWVFNHWWYYESKVELHPVGNRLELVLEGIDTIAHIYFNGKKLGQSDNMYVPFVYDVTDIARDGSNTVGVVIENAPDEMGQIGHTSRTFTQKARFQYKWDWCTRLIGMGLYRPAYIREYEAVRLDDWYFKPVGICGDAELYLNLHGDYAGCTVKVAIGDFAAELPVHAKGYAKTKLHVNNVKLWYPVDAGEQALYDLTMEIVKDGRVIDTYVKTVGFKQLVLTENDNAPLGAFHYVFTCNGKKVYVKGVNLTPMDQSCYNDPVVVEKTLQKLRDAHINMVRVWGGGTIEDEIFYNACDRMGIMVWQEFIQSSSGIDNVPSKRPEFLYRIHDTAVWATKTLRNHVSLCVWSGGNELTDEQGVPATFADMNIGMLLGVVKTYSPHVEMLPTSASGPNEFGNPANVGENHDIHGSWKYMGVEGHYTYFNTIDSMFHSEFGVDGMASVETLKTFLSEEHLKPTNMGADHIWRHHGEWWDTSWRDNHIFGVPTTLEEQVTRSQFMQAEGLRYAIEANRRRAYENSGSVIWQANELYPNVSSTSLLDYRIEGKPAYFQIAKAFAPLNVSLKYDKLVYMPGEIVKVEVFVTRDNDEREVAVTAKSGDAELCGKATVGNGLSVSIGVLEITAGDKFVDITLTAEDGELSYENTVRLLVKQENGLCSDEGLKGFY